ncbi:MAG TPA: type II toxin-antitoxin system ParD family antitoxin, partial [Candidatus Kaiserbacteria bacterium]|nr:type II toxin-antitoxin system ParD family antitoxin [Candidatus Kaiserbacteria bacterium]
MRNIINISMPNEMVKVIKKEVKRGQYASTSEFFRGLVRSWQEEKLLIDLKESQSEIRKGKGKVLHSLKD